MLQITLPFPKARVNRPSDLLPHLPEALREAAAQKDYLAEYLSWLPIAEVGIPSYYPELSRSLSKLERRNLIYPIGDGLFIHVYPDPKGERDIYVPIEPVLTQNLEPLIAQVEGGLLYLAEEIGRAEAEEEKKQALLRCIDRLCTTARGDGKGKVRVTPRELYGIKYVMLRDKMGLGVLEPLILDPYIEDISCSGLGYVFVEHKVFKSLVTAITFSSHEEVDDFVIWLGERVKKPVTVRNPIVDATLPDGSRINIVYGEDITKRGSNFTIRRVSETPLSILELIEFGTLDYMMAAYLSMILEEGMNAFVVGGTASGKTTTMNALTTFLRPDGKIVSIEDTPELQTPHKNWIREVTRGAGREDTGGDVSMFDLLKAALRQRPDMIIVGEIRGEEGRIAFQAMQTGHAVMSTFHAASVEKLIQRLTGDPINVPPTHVDSLEVVIIQGSVLGPNKKRVRRILSISEIVGYDPSAKSYSYVEVFRWNPTTDTFDFPGHMNSYILEQRIALMRGIPPHKRKDIYAQLERRAKILEKLHKQKGVKGFYELFQVLAEAQRAKLF